MRKLNRLILIIVLGLGLFIGFHATGRVKQVKALGDCICNDWQCTSYYDPDGLYGSGEYSTCECVDSGWNADEGSCSASCTPGYYVCNRDSQCCPIGIVDPTPWPSGDPGDPDPGGEDGPWCGDGACNGSEDSFNCPSDCTVSCGDGSCNYGETCSSCEGDCGACPPGEFCGDGLCSITESCNTCVVDCGVCPACGDFACAGFETCSSCELDCGVCPSNFAWWQVRGGNFASESDNGYAIRSVIPDIAVCIEPSCYPYLSATDLVNTPDSDGVPLIAGGEISANGQISARATETYADATSRTRLRETYSHFYSQYSLGLSPDDDFAGSFDDALKPVVSQDAYFHSGNMTIQSPWSVADGESYVVFVDGDLTIEDPLSVGELITVDEGGFLAFVASGDIDIADTVGHSVLTNTAGNVEGVYIADGIIDIMSNGGMDQRFVGEGTFAGWTDVVMARDYNGGVDNDLYPAETFVYRPDFVKNAPEKMKRSQMLWQETN